eukprot:267176-Rhodomonas_salina.3
MSGTALAYGATVSHSNVRHTPKSHIRNRIPGANCTENAVSCIAFRGVLSSRMLLPGPRGSSHLCGGPAAP